MKHIYHLPILLLAGFFVSGLKAQTITAVPNSVEAGAIDVPIIITGVGTDFIPGMTTCVEATSGFSSLTIFGEAISATEFMAEVTVPVFNPPGAYDLRIYQGPLCSGPSWTCDGCLNICTQKTILPNVTHASCFGCSDGAIGLVVIGGSPPYQFEWSNGATTPSINGITAGNYDVTITDLAGCPSVESFTIMQPEPITLSPAFGNQGTTFQFTINGSFTDFIPGQTTCGEISNGSEIYQFTGTALSPSVFSATMTLPPDAPSDAYNVVLYAGPGCSGPTWGCTDCFQTCIPMTLFVEITDAICVGCPNGAINLSVFGGSFPLSYQWSNGGTNQDLTGIGVGTYEVTVTDDSGCKEYATYFVGQPDPISVTPNNVLPGGSTSIAIIGSTTSLIPGTTTCVEFTNGAQTYSMGGNASSELFFTGTLMMPPDAIPGTYDVTIYQGPSCSGTSWTCFSCFNVDNPFSCGGAFVDMAVRGEIMKQFQRRDHYLS